uniref:2-dehydropantoate 2-reductase n=1 Tax=Strigomonas culicis TaxID=28005 RepID=T1YRL0_9TRYP|nr:2-dehydropantoate 2-reductase [Strigomonas culicis]
MRIKEFYIVGLGALGGMYGSLAMAHQDKNAGVVPKFIVDSERRHRYMTSEIYVNGARQHFQFVTPEEQALRQARAPGREADTDDGLIVVLICTKYMSLPAALEQCRPFVCRPPTPEEDEAEEDGAVPPPSYLRPNVVLFSVINGITKEAVMCRYYPPCAIVAGVAQAVAGRALAPTTTGNRIDVQYDYIGKIHIGEADGDVASPRLQALAQYLNNAGIPCEVQSNIRRVMWSKFMLNVGVNQAVTAAMGTYADIQVRAGCQLAAGDPAAARARYDAQRYNNPQARQWMMDAMLEALALSHFVPCYDLEGDEDAAAAGRTPEAQAERQRKQGMMIDLTEADVAYWDDVMQGVDGQQTPSMRQDVAAGRKTELELFAGTIIALGVKFNVPTPVNAELHRRITALESNV